MNDRSIAFEKIANARDLGEGARCIMEHDRCSEGRDCASQKPGRFGKFVPG